MTSRLAHRAQMLRRLVGERGVAASVAFLFHRLIARRFTSWFEGRARTHIGAWLQQGAGPVHVYISPQDWSYPYQQRPQHMARGLAARGERVIFVSPMLGYDRALSAHEGPDGVLLTPHAHAAIALCERPIVHLLSTDASVDDRLVAAVTARGGLIVYDYIDALDQAVSSGRLSPARRALHDRLIAGHVPSAVVVSADLLLREVAHARSAHFALITNGADAAPFMAARRSLDGLRADMADIVRQGRPMIGYYGSFASWFDYDLMNALARARPAYAVVAIGPDLDGTRHRLDATLKNLYVLSAMTYGDLPRHAVWFDVCLVPFVVNDITLATSPLKIFEYMALGKPTVSTDLPECRKYKSIVTATSVDAFLLAVDQAVERGADPAFVAATVAEGRANAWASKVEDLLQLIDRARTAADTKGESIRC